MAQQVRFYSHACIAIEGERETLLIDPWLSGDVFNNSWSLHAPPDFDTIDFGRLRHIWLSHEHPDHMHFPSLRRIREHVQGPVTIHYRRRQNPTVREALAKLGFNVVELREGKETSIAEDISGTLFPAGFDSALVIRLGDRVIVNQNDCSLTGSQTKAIKRMFPRIDAWFFQFSLGGYYANADDPGGLRTARDFHLGLIARYFAALRPAIFVPFASFFYFSKRENAFLNEWSVTPAQLVDALPHLPTQVLWSGDVLLWERCEARNAVNLARWTEVLRGPVTVKPHAQIPEGEIFAAAQSFVRGAIVSGAALYCFGEIHLEIKETGRAVAIDCENGRCELLGEADPRKLAITAPAEELLFFFKSSQGGDLFYGSCFHASSIEKWRALRTTRNAMAEAGPSRMSALKLMWCIAKADQKYLNGILRRWHRTIRAQLNREDLPAGDGIIAARTPLIG